MFKRAFWAIALALLLPTLLPQGKAFATDVTSGSLSETIVWQYENGTLTITGEGDINGWDNNSAAPWRVYWKDITKIVIGEGIRTTGSHSFMGLSEAKDIQLPSTLEQISFGSFGYCIALEQIEIPSGVKEIQEKAFEGCKSLKNVVIPNSVETLGDKAFMNCLGLESVKLSENLTSLRSCFYGCSSLTSISLPKSITHIEGTFTYCAKLARVEILGKLVEIGNFTFQHYYALEWLDFPSSLKRIENQAFYNCRALQYIRFNGDFPTLSNTGVFDLLGPETCIVYYPVNNQTWTQQRKAYLLDCFAHYIVLEPFGIPECQHIAVVTSGKPATCTETGLSGIHTCSLCGEILKTQTIIAVLGHDLMTVTMKPNCTEPGFDFHQCSRCSHREISNIVQPLGHSFGDWETVKEPSPEAPGLAHRVCTTCTETEQQELEKLTPQPTEPPSTEPSTQPATQPNPPEILIESVSVQSKDRIKAGIGIVLALLTVVVAIFIVKWLTGKRPGS